MIDTITFFNEIELLDLRLNVLDPVVSDFVIVQANLTHSNKPKPYFLNLEEKRWDKWRNKIHLLNLDLAHNKDRNTWTLENAQRDAIFDVLETLNLEENDHIMCGDVDEFPDPDIVNIINKTETEQRVIALKMKLFYYFFNLAFDGNDQNYNFLYNTRITSWKYLKEVVKSTHQLRVWPLDKCFLVENKGWHFSFLNTPENIKAKIEAFAHQEFNVPRLTNVENISYNMKLGKDPFNRSFTFSKKELDETYPSYILQNKETLQQWIKK